MLKQYFLFYLLIVIVLLAASCSKDKNKREVNPVVFEADIDNRHWVADSIKVFRYPGYSNYGQNVFGIIAFTRAGESIQLRTFSDWPSTQTFREVTLMQFKAQQDIRNSNNILLTWSTVNEMNASKFEIERSDDGIHFFKVGEVPAAGNTTTQTDYAWRDKPFITNLEYYYRLRVVDNNNTTAYSQVLIIYIGAVAAYFSSNNDTAYHYGFDGKIVLSATDTVHHTISGTFFFDYVDDSGGVKHSIRNGSFKDLPY